MRLLIILILLSPFLGCQYSSSNIAIKKDSLEIGHDSIKREIAIKDSISREKNKEIIKKLTPLFIIKKDEFSNDPIKWYKPKNIPKFVNYNAFYCYFETINNKPQNFRLVLQYDAEDWLFINEVLFSIDGKAYQFIPTNMKRDNGNGGEIWEWFDDQIANSDINLIEALVYAKDAKMKLVGSQYTKTKSITKSQISTIRNAYKLFVAMGGRF